MIIDIQRVVQVWATMCHGRLVWQCRSAGSGTIRRRTCLLLAQLWTVLPWQPGTVRRPPPRRLAPHQPRVLRGFSEVPGDSVGRLWRRLFCNGTPGDWMDEAATNDRRSTLLPAVETLVQHWQQCYSEQEFDVEIHRSSHDPSLFVTLFLLSFLPQVPDVVPA